MGGECSNHCAIPAPLPSIFSHWSLPSTILRPSVRPPPFAFHHFSSTILDVFKISFRKRRINWKKTIQNIQKTSVLNAVLKRKILSFIPPISKKNFYRTLKLRWRCSKLTCEFQKSVQISKISVTRDVD